MDTPIILQKHYWFNLVYINIHLKTLINSTNLYTLKKGNNDEI